MGELSREKVAARGKRLEATQIESEAEIRKEFEASRVSLS